MVLLGRANSRMKDFYDIWILSRLFDFDDDRLARAIASAFERRETPIPTEVAHALTDAFAKARKSNGNGTHSTKAWHTNPAI